MIPLPKGAVAVDDMPPLPQGAVLQPETAYDRFLNSIQIPKFGGNRVAGPMAIAGTGELIKGAGALTQLAFPETGQNISRFGETLTDRIKEQYPVAGTTGQIASYLAPFSAAQKTATAIGNIPQVVKAVGQIPSFARATTQQAAIGGTLGYGLTPDDQNREQAALFGTVTGAATPLLEKGIRATANLLRGTAPSQGTLQAAKEGLETGYVIPPTQVKPSLLNRFLEGAAGKISTAQNASFKNQQITNELAAKSLGLPEDTLITPDILQNIRTQAGKAYENLGASGTIKTSPKFFQALDEIKPYKDAVQSAKDFPTSRESSIIGVIDELKQNSFDVNSAVSKINLLRNDADIAYRAGNKDLGKANKEASKVLENTIENYLANTKQTELLDKFRQARQTIAKSYSVENALNIKTGTIDAKKLAAQLQKGKPLTGELKEVAEFGTAFPTAVKTPEAMGSIPQISPLDVSGALLTSGGAYFAGGEAATPLGFATLLARPSLRAAALSGPVQNRLIQQQSTSPDVRNLARMLMLQGATKAGANQEER